MTRTSKKQLGGVAVGCLIALAVFGVARSQGAKSTVPAISADQAIACVKTAVAAKAGNVHGMDIDDDGGKLTCEVEIVTPDGKRFEVEVDVAGNKVIEVEADE